MKILASYLLNLIDTNKIEDYVKVLNYYDKVKEFYEDDELGVYDEEDHKKKIYAYYEAEKNYIYMSDKNIPNYKVIIWLVSEWISITIDGKEYAYAIKEKTYLHDFVRVLLKDLHLIL